MAVKQLKDDRWICYWRGEGPNGKMQIKRKYFGRESDAENRAKGFDKENSIRLIENSIGRLEKKWRKRSAN